MSLVRTFLGYYKVVDSGLFTVIEKPQITIPRTKGRKGASTPVTAGALTASIVETIEENQLIPVAELNEDLAADLEALFTDSATAVTGGNNAIKIKLSLMIPDRGPNAGAGVLSITVKGPSGKTVTQIPLESDGQPE
jgi:hypothetical protein